VTNCDRRSKLVKNNMTYFMDSPIYEIICMFHEDNSANGVARTVLCGAEYWSLTNPNPNLTIAHIHYFTKTIVPMYELIHGGGELQKQVLPTLYFTLVHYD